MASQTTSTPCTQDIRWSSQLSLKLQSRMRCHNFSKLLPCPHKQLVWARCRWLIPSLSTSTEALLLSKLTRKATKPIRCRQSKHRFSKWSFRRAHPANSRHRPARKSRKSSPSNRSSSNRVIPREACPSLASKTSSEQANQWTPRSSTSTSAATTSSTHSLPESRNSNRASRTNSKRFRTIPSTSVETLQVLLTQASMRTHSVSTSAVHQALKKIPTVWTMMLLVKNLPN